MSNIINPTNSKEQLAFVESKKTKKVTTKEQKPTIEKVKITPNDLVQLHKGEVLDISVDSGKVNNKRYATYFNSLTNKQVEYKKVMPNRISDGLESTTKDGKVLVIDGISYIVGNEAETMTEGARKSDNSKNNLHHINMMKASLFLTSVDTGYTDFNVVYGVPISTYTIKPLLTEIKNMLENHKNFTVSYGGITRTINIKNITVESEARASLGFIKPNGKQIVIDIGGLNFQAILLLSGKIQAMDTDDKGYVYLENNIVKYARAISKGEIKASDMKAYLNTYDSARTVKNDKYDSIIDSYFKDIFVDEYIDALNELGMEYSTETELIFTGGTSLKFKEDIKNVFEAKGNMVNFIQDSLFSNAKGMLLLNKNYFRKAEEQEVQA